MSIFSKKQDQQIENYQQELLQTHYHEVENMYKQMRGWRHDYRNHIQTLKAYASMNDMDAIKKYASQLSATTCVQELMGLEGMIRQTYYDAFNLILNDYEMGGRSKQPPRNEVNALISFGNMMCYTMCLRAIHQTQLNPTISFLHTPGERRYSLALDVAEVFKPVIIDRVIFKVLNKTIKHRTLNRNVSYRHLIKLECYKLAKHLLEIEEYKPFKMYW